MNKADMLIYIHPDLDAKKITELEITVASRSGVDCAAFDTHSHHHALMVQYDPDRIEGMEILDMVRNTDPVASIVGL